MIRFNGGESSAIFSSVGTNQVLLKAGGAFVDTNGQGALNFTPYIDMPMSGVGGLTKIGEGTLRISNTQTYTGNTVVQEGTLRIRGNIASSALTIVESGGTLTGDGTVGALRLEGKISPGDFQVGSMITGAETWTGGGSYDWEIANASGNSWDKITLNGVLLLDNTVQNRFTIFVKSMGTPSAVGLTADFNAALNYSFVIANTQGISGFNTNAFAVNTTDFQNPNSGNWFVSQSGNNLMLNYSSVPVPEPGVAVLLVGLGAACVLRRRPRR